MDHDYKASYAIRAAGVRQIAIGSGLVSALIVERDGGTEPTLKELLAVIDADPPDLVLVEGFKLEAFAKIELHRRTLGHPYLYPEDPNIVALATDSDPPQTELPILDLNDVEGIAAFVCRYLGLDD